MRTYRDTFDILGVNAEDVGAKYRYHVLLAHDDMSLTD